MPELTPEASQQDFLPRRNFQQKLEPVSGVLHGAGQSQEAFSEYYKLMEQQGAAPVIYMFYTGLKWSPAKKIEKLSAILEAYPKGTVIPQIGLSMTHDGQPERHYEQHVAAGDYDEAIHAMAEQLKALQIPVYIRIGYECNGPWNGYDPESFIPAFQRVTRILRERCVNFAAVWCLEAGFMDDYMKYYPGDDYVDWWSIDIFSPTHYKAAHAFSEDSLKRGKPVMIGESTPRRIGVEHGEQSWQEWYAPYFHLIRTQPAIKAFCYINWEWSEHEQWKDWGNARVQDAPLIYNRFTQELNSPLYIHAQDERLQILFEPRE